MSVKQEQYPFWYGGAGSCVGAGVTHPLDLAKARMQSSPVPGRGMLGTLWYTLKTAGFTGIYDGLSASMLRQMTYSMVRFGLYDKLKSLVQDGDKTPPISVLLPFSMLSGFAGSVVGNPADVVNVRMQNDRALPAAQRRGYRNAVDGVIKICRDEGFKALLRGVGPNATRGVAMTAGQVVSYDTGKNFLMKYFDMKAGTQSLFFAASIWAGFVATTVCSPVDVIKTRAMNASEKVSPIKVITSGYKREGLAFLFRGWTPAFIRLGPQTIIMFMTVERLKMWRVGM